MWMLVNDTPYAAERTLACDRHGAAVWLGAVKATFLIRPDGTTVVATEQEPVMQAPKHRGDAGITSLLYESDLDYTKPTTDILLHGHAYAPMGKPAASVDVTMKVSQMAKTLRVFGDRTWKKGVVGLTMTSPEPFLKMPIQYERAYGGTEAASDDPRRRGWERRNPVGTGFSMETGDLAGRRVANVEDPKALISSAPDRPRPAAFGPSARHWQPRVSFAGTYDENWQKNRLPLLPTDFDERFFQCAPEDQQTPRYLRGNESVELMNLTPSGKLRFKIPRIVLTFSTNVGGETITHRGNLHTVIFEPDVPRVLIVWHTAFPCHEKKLKVVGTAVSEKTYLHRSEAVDEEDNPQE